MGGGKEDVGKEERGRKRGEEERRWEAHIHVTQRTTIVVTWWSIQQASLGRSDSDSLEEFRGRSIT